MTNEALPLKIRYSTEFKRELKRLHKRYKRIQKDVTEFIASIKTHNFPGDVLQGIDAEAKVYKARVQNSDNKKGKSAGYRVIYAYYPPDTIFLVTIYSKSDQPDISTSEINSIISSFSDEDENADE